MRFHCAHSRPLLSAANANHRVRVLPALLSWAAGPLARRLTYFYTDMPEPDPNLLALAGDGDAAAGVRHFVVTQCAAGKRGRALCCKTGAELAGFVAALDAEAAAEQAAGAAGAAGAAAAKRSWWCHLDDDNYPLLGRLLEYLRSPRFADLPADAPVYVGRGGPVAQGNRLHAPFAMGGAGAPVRQSLSVSQSLSVRPAGRPFRTAHEYSSGKRAPPLCLASRLRAVLTILPMFNVFNCRQS
eukprot:SAG22_NODE_2681_length_2313_cov_2.675700_1_plen_242_part_00